MSTRNLDRIFKPRSIAIIGASDKKGKLGNIILKNLAEDNFSGAVYPVNPAYEYIMGRRCFHSVTGIEEQVDLAIIVTPISTVPDIMKECGIKNILGTIVISAGGKETGEEGKKIEDEIIREASKHGIRMLGPNCLGVIVPSRKMNASFASKTALSGNLAFVSQSGALCTAILDMSFVENIGFSYFISIGSMADVDFGDIIDYLGGDDTVSSIVLYVESITNARKFMSSARAVSKVKPVIVLKAGRSRSGAKAAASHTGAMAGEDDVYDAAFRRAGILRVDSINELFDCSEALAKQPIPSGDSVCVITNAGGPGVMAADKLEELGYRTTTLEKNTLDKLNSVLPPNWSKSNPVDIIGDATPGRYKKSIKICLEAEEVDGIVVILTPQAMTRPKEVAKGIAKLCSGYDKPVFAVWMGGEDVKDGIALLNESGIPTYRTPEEAINIFIKMYNYSRNLELLQETPKMLHAEMNLHKDRAEKIIKKSLVDSGSVVLSEHESKRLLKSYGIVVNRTMVAKSPDGAVKAAEKLGFPVVLKIDSPDITHKTDAGGVVLNITDKSGVRKSYSEIIENAKTYKPNAGINGVTVQRMVSGEGYEIIVGTKYDRLFGPVILFGSGGTMTEIYRDRSLGIPPLNSTLARRMIESTRIYNVLKGYRNKKPVDMLKLEEVLVRISNLVTDFPEIQEIDINPLFAGHRSVVAIDARVIVRRSSTTSPGHLVISPYPKHYEEKWKTRDGLNVLLRPIKPEDEGMIKELFSAFSEETIRSRFFELVRSVPHENIVRYTQIDYDREITIVAEAKIKRVKRLLGMGRLNYYPNLESLEFSVVVGDPWQSRGLGTKLIKKCINIARRKGVRSLWGDIGVENEGMLKLCRKLGFRIECDHEDETARAVMEL